jgi:hypothetical protein
MKRLIAKLRKYIQVMDREKALLILSEIENLLR